jgi:hypothetical protein
MNSKSTWVWLTLAAILIAAVVGVEKFWRKPPPGLTPLLPNFRAAAITSVQYTPAGQLEIRADRTNRQWHLVKPIQFPAQRAAIEALLTALQQLAPAHTISGTELRQHPNANEAFGFRNRSTLTLQSDQELRPIYIGALTAPGDGVYVQVVGGDSVFVVDARLLTLLPTKPDDWRDTALVDLRELTFDRISVSNAQAVVQLQQAHTNQPWRIVQPMQRRADNPRLITSLQRLQTTRIAQFVTDSPTADPDSFGFQTPELELSLHHDTNTLVSLQFGKSPTNDSTLIYARRVGLPAVFTVERQSLQPWLAPLNDFRDPHLLTHLPPFNLVEVTGADPFTLQFAGTNTCQLQHSDLPIDSQAVGEFLLTLRLARIQQFNESITDADLPQYGLAEPGRRIKLLGRTAANPTNEVLADLAFGETTNGLVFVRRADENPVYAIDIADYGRLAVSGWQLRNRQIWQFVPANVVRILLQSGEQKRDLRRAGANAWAVIPATHTITGSEVDKTLNQLSNLVAVAWIARGAEPRERLGFGPDSLRMTLELKDGTRHEVEFGGITPDGYPYAAVKFNDEPWYFEFPLMPYKYLEFVLLKSLFTP